MKIFCRTAPQPIACGGRVFGTVSPIREGAQERACDRLGGMQNAALDMQHALSILENTSGTPGYRKTQQIYAEILRHAGDLQRASVLDLEACSLLAGMQQHACSGCMLNMVSVR